MKYLSKLWVAGPPKVCKILSPENHIFQNKLYNYPAIEKYEKLCLTNKITSVTIAIVINIGLSSHTVSDTSYRTNVLIQLRSPRIVLMINAPQAPYYVKRYNCCIIYIMINKAFPNSPYQFIIPPLVLCLILPRRLHKYLQPNFYPTRYNFTKRFVYTFSPSAISSK